MHANVELAAELNALSETTAVARTAASRLRREIARLTKLQSLCADQLVALLARREETEAWHAASLRELEDLEASITAEHKRNEVRRPSLGERGGGQGTSVHGPFALPRPRCGTARPRTRTASGTSLFRASPAPANAPSRRRRWWLGRCVALEGRAWGHCRQRARPSLLQEGVRRNLQTEIAAYTGTLRRLRDEIESVQQARQMYTDKCEEATQVLCCSRRRLDARYKLSRLRPASRLPLSRLSAQVYFTVTEGVKLQELQIGALQRKLDEGHGRLKQQQTLYDAVKDDRAAYKKNLTAAYAEISEMKRAFRGLATSIESIKDEITGKDTALLREHAEHARVESEKVRSSCGWWPRRSGGLSDACGIPPPDGPPERGGAHQQADPVL